MIATHAAALLYIGLSGLLLFLVSLRVTLLRRKHRVALGSGGNADLERACRAQANFVEYTPIFLLVLAGLAFAREPVFTIHALGLLFLAGRIVHAWAMYQDGPNHLRGRPVGMLLTWGPLIVASVMLIGIAVTGVR
jgi:uncharacterized membrane protein YecN with MAPEG domain